MSLTVFLADYADAPDIIGALHSQLIGERHRPSPSSASAASKETAGLRIDAMATRDRSQIKPILLDDLPLAAGARCHGVRAHDFIFLSGVDAGDSNGKVTPPATIQFQTATVLNRIGKILHDQKLSLADLCRTFMFMPSTDFAPRLWRGAQKAVYKNIFEEDQFPPNSASTFKTWGRGYSPAFPWPSPTMEKQTIVASPKVRKAPGSFSQSVRVGDWLLQAGQDAVGFNRVVGRLKEISPVRLKSPAACPKTSSRKPAEAFDDIAKTTVYLIVGQDRSSIHDRLSGAFSPPTSAILQCPRD